MAAVLTTVLLWASAFVVIRSAGKTFEPGALAFLRLLFGTAALAVIALRHRRPLPRGRALGLVLGYGLLWFAAYTVVLNWAERHLDAGTSALLVNFAPALVALVAGRVFGEGYPPRLLAGIGIATAGVVVIAIGSDGGGTSDGLGVALALLSAVLYASGVLLQKAALRTVDAVSATWVGCAAGLLATVPFAPSAFDQLGAAPTSDILGALFLGVGPTAIAFTTWAYALTRTNAGTMAATTLVVPGLAILISWIALGEVPTAWGFVGGALALGGVVLTRLPGRAQRRAARTVPSSAASTGNQVTSPSCASASQRSSS